MDLLVDKVAEELKIKFFGSNNCFIFNKNDKLIDIKVLGEESLIKLDNLKNFCSKIGIEISQCACVGDGDNDLELFKKTGHGITFKGSKLEKYAWKTIENLTDIRRIL